MFSSYALGGTSCGPLVGLRSMQDADCGGRLQRTPRPSGLPVEVTSVLLPLFWPLTEPASTEYCGKAIGLSSIRTYATSARVRPRTVASARTQTCLFGRPPAAPPLS